MRLPTVLILVMMNFSVGAADLSEQYVQGQLARVAMDRKSHWKMRKEAADEALLIIAEKLTDVLHQRHVEVTPAQLLSPFSDDNINVSQHAVLQTGGFMFGPNYAAEGWAKITIHYREGTNVCRLDGERRIFTKSLGDRLGKLIPHFTWVTGPDCVAAPN